MHDDLMERRLRDALRTEGDSLAFTITSGELERRIGLRRRRAAFRPTAVLLAAAVGIGLIGVAGIVGGWFERNPDATPPPALVAVVGPSPSGEPVNPPRPSASAPARDLPTLEDLIHSGPVDDVVFAQGSGPEDLAAPPDVPVAHRSSVQLGPVPSGLYRVDFGCLSRAGAEETAAVGLVPAGTTADPGPLVPCGGRMTTTTITSDGASALRLTVPGAASWRLVVHAVSDVPALPPATPTRPVSIPGEEVLIDASSPATHAKPGATDAIGEPIDVGQIKFRERYVFRASCAGSTAIAYHNGPYDPSAPFLPESTTLVQCDGAVHEMIWRPGDRPAPDILVTAADGTTWRLLVTADPAPIATTPDDGGWTEVVSSGPRFGSDDLNEALVGRLTGDNALARVVVSCQDGTSVDVSVSRGDQTGDLQRFEAECSDQPSTTVGDPFVSDAQGGFSVDVEPHGRMWTAITVQQAPPSAAP